MLKKLKSFFQSKDEQSSAEKSCYLTHEELPIACLILDRQRTIVYVNSLMAILIGCKRQQLVGLSVQSLTRPRQDEKLNTYLRQISAASQNSPQPLALDINLYNNLGTCFPVVISGAKLVNSNEANLIICVHLAESDSTKLRNLEAKVSSYSAKSDRKSRFIADMSHEIRTPLNSVLGMIDLLAATHFDDKRMAYLRSLKTSARVLRSLVDKVLDFSKIEAGELKIENRPFNLKLTLTEIINTFLPQADAASLSLDLVLNLDHDCYEGDVLRLTQVLNNLIGNALKFTASGRIKVEASSSMLLVGGDTCRLTISVTDTGAGIDPQICKSIFDCYLQASQVDGGYGSSGLGLFISKQVVTAMGGEITVKSRLGVGSKFEFCIDLQRSYIPVEFVETEPPARLQPLEGARVLVAEDDLSNQALLTAWLTQAGAIVVCCGNGKEAIAKLEDGFAYDAVLMDVSMPIMDGLKATKHIRQMSMSRADLRYLEGLVILGISGHAFTDDITRCLDAGMTDILTKPLSRLGTLQLLSTALLQKDAAAAS